MAHDAPPEEIVTVKDYSRTFHDLADFFSQKAFADIVLNLNGQKTYAHKTEYELTMPDASQEAFQKVIEYIYKGTISISSCDGNVLSDLLILAKKFSLQKLETMMSEKMTTFLDLTNVFALLNRANKYNMNNLTEVCHNFIDIHAWDCLKTRLIYTLTEKSVVKLLERDSFALPEMEVFKIVSKWCQINKNKSVVQCVRLCNLSSDEILKVVWPSKLMEDGKLLEILAEINDGKSRTPQHRARSIFDRNLATQDYKAKVIAGSNTSWLLSDTEDLTKCASHQIGDRNGITVDLGVQCYFNHIKMRLSEDRSYRYYIECSLDKENWDTILDYRRYDCRSYQNLYFETKLARYVRVVGTEEYQQCFMDFNQYFKLIKLRIYLKEQIPKVVGQVVCPVENVATEKMGACFSGSHSQNSGYGSSYGHSITITVQLAQPYMISVIRLMVCGVTSYSYKINKSGQVCVRKKLSTSNPARGEEWKEIRVNPEPTNCITVTFSNLQVQTVFHSDPSEKTLFGNSDRAEEIFENRLKSENFLTQGGLQPILFYRRSNPVLYFECFVKNEDIDKAQSELTPNSIEGRRFYRHSLKRVPKTKPGIFVMSQILSD